MTTEKYTAPLVALAALTLCGTAYQIAIIYLGGAASPRSQYLYLAGFSFAIAWWVEIDRRRRAISMPFEFAAFMFFSWIFLLPYYLFKTRRWRGLGLAFGAILVSSVPDAAAFIMWSLM